MGKDSQHENLLFPPDQHERDRILEELDRNVLVEAAAGTGKTTSMLGRMVALLKKGKCKNIRHMAAVTFTRKAAAELRSRFQIALEQAARESKGKEKKNLAEALAHIEHCFVGTIHSFCARLLRERPIEAQVDLNFQELDEMADERLRKESWDTFVARLLAHDRRGTLEKLAELGLGIQDLAPAFKRYADYPDVDYWPVPESKEAMPDLKPAVRALRSYVFHMKSLAPRLPSDPGGDTLVPEYLDLPRIVRHCADLNQSSQLMQVLERFNRSKRVVQKAWGSAPEAKRTAKEEQNRWDHFRRETAQPMLRAWQEFRYGPMLSILHDARKLYDELRQERGVLNYQDLLMKAAYVLRDKPRVRKYFQDRFPYLLVDEFQDTDPIQAEVMLLLTAEDLEERDWRKSRPRPGSLFVVGDPKQSIYRFRRADIVTYNKVKEIIAGGKAGETKGLILKLTTNFRAHETLVDRVNQVFAPDPQQEKDYGEERVKFPEKESEESPAYVALKAGRSPEKEGELCGVHFLDVPEEFSTLDEALNYEADFIARTLRFWLDGRCTLSRTKQELEAGKEPFVTPNDIMILTRNTTNLSLYAQKLQAYNIPHQVTGGSALNEVKELKLLYFCLDALAHPEDPLALVAALRSELFGISDAALYAFKKRGGTFDYSKPVPKSISLEDQEAIVYAIEKLQTYFKWLDRLPPLAFIEKIVSDLGLSVRACTHPGGDVQSGSLSKALEILRSRQGDMWTLSHLVDYLAQLIEAEEKFDGLSARSGEQPFVRIMNLHKAKGLEAPVVFLADPSGDSDHEVELYIDRTHDQVRGYLKILGPAQGWVRPTLAQPPGWESLAKREKKFQLAESLRLRYVALTRAGANIIITKRGRNPGRNRTNPWRYFIEDLKHCPVLPDPGDLKGSIEPKGLITLPRAMIQKAHEEIHQRVESLRWKTHDFMKAKEYAFSRKEERFLSGSHSAEQSLFNWKEDETLSEGEYGVEWGSVIHQILHLAMTNPEADLKGAARLYLSENGLDENLAEQAEALVQSVMGSNLWQRALASKLRLVEVPFQINREEPKDSGSYIPLGIRGVIDLVFKESNGWVVVDYKTDRVTRRRLDHLVDRHKAQVDFYAEAWEESTGQKVKEKGIYFTHLGRYIQVFKT